MNKQILCIMLCVILLLSCKQETNSKKNTVTQTQTSQNTILDDDLAEKERIELADKILKNLREPKLIEHKFKQKTNGEYPEKSIQASLGLGYTSNNIEIYYKDEDIQKCSRELVQHLPVIYKNTEYSKVKEEIIRIFTTVELEETIKPLIELAFFTKENPRIRSKIIRLLTSRLMKFGADKYVNLMQPLLDDKDESVVLAVLESLRKTKSKSVMNVLEERYKAENWGTTQLNLLYTISEIDPTRKSELIEYINEIFRLLYADRMDLRFNALLIVKQLKESSFLEVLLKCFNNEKYKEREDFIFGMEAYYDDPRVKDLFREILQSETYPIEYKMAVVNRFKHIKDISVNKLIFRLADTEMSIEYEFGDENYYNAYECLSALKNNGDAETIKELQKLKTKHPDSAEDIDNAIDEIRKRIND